MYRSAFTLAGCGPFEERNETIPVMENLQGMATCYTTKEEKAKGKNYRCFKILTARNAASAYTLFTSFT
jgi:hypothetical protein